MFTTDARVEKRRVEQLSLGDYWPNPMRTSVWGLYGVSASNRLSVWHRGQISINAPILSLQSLISVLFMTYAVQAEWTAGVYVAALSQHSVILAMIAILSDEGTAQ